MPDALEICHGKKPPGWVDGELWGPNRTWRNAKKRLMVMAGLEEHSGETWLHVSMSHRRRMPTYDEMCYLKRHWFGEETLAVEIHAPTSQHINHHEFCRHLWTNMSKPEFLPDMRKALPGTKGMTI